MTNIQKKCCMFGRGCPSMPLNIVFERDNYRKDQGSHPMSKNEIYFFGLTQHDF